VDKPHTPARSERIERFQFSGWVPFPVERVFLFFANPENLPRMMPPSTATRIDALRLVRPREQAWTGPPDLAGAGSEIVTSFRVVPFLGVRATWIARITEFEWNHHFADMQVKGPFRLWRHRHELHGESRGGVSGTTVSDKIECQVGFGALGRAALKFMLARQIASTFRYRQKVLPQLLAGN
jgi:ligand-binding SRPBCC domain-containing protein